MMYYCMAMEALLKEKQSIIRLMQINKENLENVLKLSISVYQKNSVSSVAYYLAQSWVYSKTAFLFVICQDRIPIGFV